MAVVLAQSLGQPLPEASLAALEAEDKPLAEKHRDLASLRAGVVMDWNGSRSAGTETSLDRMRQRLAWMQPDDSAAELDSSTLQEGLALLEGASAPGPWSTASVGGTLARSFRKVSKPKPSLR